MKLIHSFSMGLGAAFLLAFPSLSQVPELTRELYDFCQKSPYNSRCEGLGELPVALEDRPGEDLFNCKFEFARQGLKASKRGCKAELVENQLKLYFETGEPVAALNNKRATFTVEIPIDKIFSLQQFASYRPAFMFSKNMTGIVKVGYFSDDIDPATSNLTSYLQLEGSSLLGQTLETAWLNNANAQFVAVAQTLQSRSKRQSSAAGEVALQQLQQTNTCVACDLRNANLAGFDLRGANLERANLAGANLEGSNLERAYLVGANLEKASLRNARISQGRLAYANFARADLSEAHLRGSDLRGAQLRHATLVSADLKTDHRHVTSLIQANLIGANLAGAELVGVRLDGAMFIGANLAGANLASYRAKNGRGTGTDMIEYFTVLTQSDFRDANLSNVRLDLAVMLKTNMQGSNLAGANLEGAKLAGANLSQANLRQVRLKRVVLWDVNFTGATLDEVNWGKAKFCRVQMPDGELKKDDCDFLE